MHVHFPGKKHVNFKTGASLQDVCDKAESERSKLEAWFIANHELPIARDFIYAEFPSNITWLSKQCKWKPRQRGEVVGRLTEVHATTGDLLFLRMLLMRKKRCTSFEELRTVEGVIHESFKEACAALGLLENDNQWHDAIVENVHSLLAKQFREMFVNILSYCQVSNPLKLWNCHWRCMSDDITLSRRRIT